MTRVFQFLIAALLALLCVLVAYLCIGARKVVHLADRADLVLEETQKAVKVVSDAAAEQAARLRDPRNSKALDAAIQAAAVYNGTGRLINREIVPRAMKTLDSADLALTNFAAAARGLDRLITETNGNLNSHLLPEASLAIYSITRATDQTADLARTAQESLKATGDDIHCLLADPALAAAPREVLASLENIRGVTAQLEEASRQAPAIAADLEKISKASAKFSKPILIARIVSLLSNLLPWLW